MAKANHRDAIYCISGSDRIAISTGNCRKSFLPGNGPLYYNAYSDSYYGASELTLQGGYPASPRVSPELASSQVFGKPHSRAAESPRPDAQASVAEIRCIRAPSRATGSGRGKHLRRPLTEDC